MTNVIPILGQNWRVKQVKNMEEAATMPIDVDKVAKIAIKTC